MSISDTTAAAALAAIKTALDGGRLYLFTGAVPADADDALDMVSTHTQIAEFTESNDGATGLTFASPSGGSMVKDPTETWEGLVAFSGFESAESTLSPTFWRFCAAGDDGQDAGIAPRLQGTAGGPLTDMPMADQTDNASNTVVVDTFIVAIDAT